jgi:hypothetical protein
MVLAGLGTNTVFKGSRTQEQHIRRHWIVALDGAFSYCLDIVDKE